MILRSIYFSCLVASLISLSACSASVDSISSPFDAFGKADSRELPSTARPLAGTLKGKAWAAGNAIARFRDGEYNVVIADASAGLTCNNWFPAAPHVSFFVSEKPGVYEYDGSASGKIVNVVFPYRTETGGGSDTVLSSKSRIEIDGVVGAKLVGRVAALSAEGSSNDVSIGGSFSAEICDGPAGLLAIHTNGLEAFKVAYSEAVRVRSGEFEVRLMNKVPSRKCYAREAWMMTEAPIKYLSIRVPDTAKAFSVVNEVMEYGDQGSSSGWSTDYFKGAGQVSSVSNKDVVFSLEAKGSANLDIQAQGQWAAPICP